MATRARWSWPRKMVLVGSLALLATTPLGVGCKSELDDAPAADPLDDPWVAALDEGDPEPAPVEPAEAALAGTSGSVSAGVGTTPGTATEPADPGEPGLGTGATPGAAAATPAAGGPGRSGGQPGAAASQPPAGSVEPSAASPTSEPAAPSGAALEPAPTPAAEPAPPAEPQGPTLADLDGKYRFVGGSAQRSELDAAIETAANSLPSAIRGIARKRLTKTNPIDDHLEIDIVGAQIQTLFASGFDARCELDGATVHWTSKKGDQYKVRLRAKGSKLVQIIEGEDGVKTTVFVLSADKQRLTVHHKITADRLAEPMTYRLSYQRQ